MPENENNLTANRANGWNFSSRFF